MVPPPAQAQAPQELVQTISAALGGVLQNMRSMDGMGGMSGQDLLQLGLGLGMGLGLQNSNALASASSASVSNPPAFGGSSVGPAGPMGDTTGSAPSPVTKLPDISDLYKGHSGAGGADGPAPKDAQAAGSSASASNDVSLSQAVGPTPTPDERKQELPPDLEFTTHKAAGLGSAFVDKPKPGEKSTQHLVPGTGGHLQKCTAVIPEGFIESVNYTHTASQSVDYLPHFSNTNEAKSVGCVKPRRAAEDWLVIGFDPWSAGKNPLSTEFIEDLEAEIKGPDGDDGAGGKKPKLADLSGLDEIREVQSQQNKDETDIQKMETWVRHGKYTEIENMLDSPEWTLPIDHKDIHGNTVFSIACQNGNKRLAKLFLRRGADINSTNLAGQTSLHYCFAYGFEDLAEYLIEKGADDSITNADNLTCYEGLSAEAVDTL